MLLADKSRVADLQPTWRKSPVRVAGRSARIWGAVSADPHKLTQLLDRAAQGESDAAEEILPLVYSQLRDLARARMQALAPGQTLQPTALVHEAWMRISSKQSQGWDGRRHFFFAAARAMRDILVEGARKKGAAKRGGDRLRIDLEDLGLSVQVKGDELLALDEALQRLEIEDPDGHRIVTLRYYGGLTVAEVAELLEVTTRTIERRWRFLRAWLAGEVDK